MAEIRSEAENGLVNQWRMLKWVLREL